MITIIITHGESDDCYRKAPVITDELLSSIPAITNRGRQELAKNLWVMRNRTLAMPHKPDAEVGDIEDYTFTKLGMAGNHRVTSLSINITQRECRDTVALEQIALKLNPCTFDQGLLGGPV